jgi:hypothetical protein
MPNPLIVIGIGAVGLVLLLHFLLPKRQKTSIPDVPQLRVQKEIQEAQEAQTKSKKNNGFSPVHVENMMRELEEDRDIY